MCATERQKKAVKEIAENRRSVSGAMKVVGYKKNTYTKPKNLTESKGFQELMEQAGLTDDFLNTALYSDIKSKPKNRKPELELAYKLKKRLIEKVDIESGGKPLGVIQLPFRKNGDSLETDTNKLKPLKEESLYD